MPSAARCAYPSLFTMAAGSASRLLQMVYLVWILVLALGAGCIFSLLYCTKSLLGWRTGFKLL